MFEKSSAWFKSGSVCSVAVSDQFLKKITELTLCLESGMTTTAATRKFSLSFKTP